MEINTQPSERHNHISTLAYTKKHTKSNQSNHTTEVINDTIHETHSKTRRGT